jgi:glycosyltransferase involved in cell wall biosynthesis
LAYLARRVGERSLNHTGVLVLRIAYVTTYDANDRIHWSGLGHSIMESLRGAGLDVVPVGPLKTQFNLLGQVKGRLYHRVFRRQYDFQREALPGYGYARQIGAKLREEKFNLIFSPGAIPVSRLSCRQPIVIWADATFASYITHYGLDHEHCAETVRAGHRTEKQAFDRSSLLIFASEWAAESAIADYGVSRSKIRVVPFGANFNDPPCRETALHMANSRAADRCQLITIGVDWYRKGVARSIELASLLNRRGLRTDLTVVGCRVPGGTTIPGFVNVVPFVDKRTRDGEKIISELLARSHFHVLFSHAEAFGVVFAEANAHAVPNIASNVGGVGSAVVNGQGGQRFNVTASIQEIADYVQALMRNRNLYIELAAKARQEYEHRLNWMVAGAAVRRHLEALPMDGKT